MNYFVLSLKSNSMRKKKLNSPLHLSPYDKDANYTPWRKAAKIVGESEFGVLYLSRAALSLELLILLVHHPQP